MLVSDLKLIDLKKNFNEYRDIWHDCQNYIRQHCRDDLLFRNYVNINFDDFLSFTAAINNDDIAAFGAVEVKPQCWGAGVARALTRFWINPKYRTQGLTKWRNSKIKYSPTVLRPQLEFLKTQAQIQSVIITREGDYPRSFTEIIRLANTVSDREFIIMPGRYNVCECMKSPPESCRQFVATNDVEHFRLAQSQGYLQQYE